MNTPTPTTNWWASKTIWLNMIAIALEGINEISPFVTDPKWIHTLTIALALLNIVNRFFTSKPIEGTKAATAGSLVLMLALMASAPTAQAQSPNWGASVYYDVRTRDISAVAMHRLTVFTGFLGHKDWSLDLDAFAGSTLAGKPLGGFALGKRFPVANQIEAYFGVAAATSAGRATGAGLIGGLSVRF